MSDDCDCEFDFPEPDGEPSWHYKRTCELCGFEWGALHCPHDGAQNPCPGCGWIEPGKRTPGQISGLSAHTPVDAEDVRQLELARLDAMYDAAVKVLEAEHVTVSQGRVVMLDDKPLKDDAPVLRAIETMLRIQQRRAGLLGLDAKVQHDMGIAEREIAIAEGQGELLAGVMMRVLDALDLPTDKQSTAIDVMTRELRAIEGGAA